MPLRTAQLLEARLELPRQRRLRPPQLVTLALVSHDIKHRIVQVSPKLVIYYDLHFGTGPMCDLCLREDQKLATGIRMEDRRLHYELAMLDRFFDGL
jgi:hypothetical protein